MMKKTEKKHMTRKQHMMRKSHKINDDSYSKWSRKNLTIAIYNCATV